MKKEKYLQLLLWGIVAYAVALLSYFTLKMFGHGADYISAFGSILSSVATFFAAYIAVALFNNWKDQHNAQILANDAINLIKLIHNDIELIAELNVEIKEAIHINKFDLIFVTNVLNLSENLLVSQNAQLSNFNLFYRLTKNDNLREMIEIHSNKIRDISEKFVDIIRYDYDKERCYELIHSSELICSETSNIFENLKKYILVE